MQLPIGAARPAPARNVSAPSSREIATDFMDEAIARRVRRRSRRRSRRRARAEDATGDARPRAGRAAFRPGGRYAPIRARGQSRWRARDGGTAVARAARAAAETARWRRSPCTAPCDARASPARHATSVPNGPRRASPAPAADLSDPAAATVAQGQEAEGRGTASRPRTRETRARA